MGFWWQKRSFSLSFACGQKQVLRVWNLKNRGWKPDIIFWNGSCVGGGGIDPSKAPPKKVRPGIASSNFQSQLHDAAGRLEHTKCGTMVAGKVDNSKTGATKVKPENGDPQQLSTRGLPTNRLPQGDLQTPSGAGPGMPMKIVKVGRCNLPAPYSWIVSSMAKHMFCPLPISWSKGHRCARLAYFYHGNLFFLNTYFIQAAHDQGTAPTSFSSFFKVGRPGPLPQLLWGDRAGLMINPAKNKSR